MLTIFHAGSFGSAVAARVKGAVPSARLLPLSDSAASFDELVRGAAFVGVALWRRYPTELDQLDEACARNQIPWSSVVLEDTRVRCGPLVTPGRGPCHACYCKRWLTHSPHPRREAALDAVFRSNLRFGIPGFTPSSLRIAAAALLLDREDLACGGRVRLIDLLHCNVEETRVVRVHGCPRCSIKRESGDRFATQLSNELKRAAI